MNNELEGLIRVTKANIKPAAASLGRAFKEFPLYVYYYPDNTLRMNISRRLVSTAAYHAIR